MVRRLLTKKSTGFLSLCGAANGLSTQNSQDLTEWGPFVGPQDVVEGFGDGVPADNKWEADFGVVSQAADTDNTADNTVEAQRETVGTAPQFDLKVFREDVRSAIRSNNLSLIQELITSNRKQFNDCTLNNIRKDAEELLNREAAELLLDLGAVPPVWIQDNSIGFEENWLSAVTKLGSLKLLTAFSDQLDKLNDQLDKLNDQHKMKIIKKHPHKPLTFQQVHEASTFIGVMPIQMASLMDRMDIVEFFRSKGVELYDHLNPSTDEMYGDQVVYAVLAWASEMLSPNQNFPELVRFVREAKSRGIMHKVLEVAEIASPRYIRMITETNMLLKAGDPHTINAMFSQLRTDEEAADHERVAEIITANPYKDGTEEGEIMATRSEKLKRIASTLKDLQQWNVQPTKDHWVTLHPDKVDGAACITPQAKEVITEIFKLLGNNRGATTLCDRLQRIDDVSKARKLAKQFFVEDHPVVNICLYADSDRTRFLNESHLDPSARDLAIGDYFSTFTPHPKPDDIREFIRLAEATELDDDWDFDSW